MLTFLDWIPSLIFYLMFSVSFLSVSILENIPKFSNSLFEFYLDNYLLIKDNRIFLFAYESHNIPFLFYGGDIFLNIYKNNSSFFESCLLLPEVYFFQHQLNSESLGMKQVNKMTPQSLSLPTLVFHRQTTYFCKKRGLLPWGKFWTVYCGHLLGWRWEIRDWCIFFSYPTHFLFSSHPSCLLEDSKLYGCSRTSPGRLLLHL